MEMSNTDPSINQKGGTTTMSYKPFARHEIKNATPETIREELDKYFAYVQQHDPKSLKFALMVAGYGETDGSTNMCSMIGGSPQTIAYVITELVDELVDRNPTFAIFFLLNFLQRLRDRQIDNTNNTDVEVQVKELLDKLRNGTPPNGSIH